MTNEQLGKAFIVTGDNTPLIQVVREDGTRQKLYPTVRGSHGPGSGSNLHP